LRATVLAPPQLEELEAVTKKRDDMPLENWLTAMERVLLKYNDWETAPPMWQEDYNRLSELMSFAVTYIDKIPTVKEFVDGIIRDTEDILAGWRFLKR